MAPARKKQRLSTDAPVTGEESSVVNQNTDSMQTNNEKATDDANISKQNLTDDAKTSKQQLTDNANTSAQNLTDATTTSKQSQGRSLFVRSLPPSTTSESLAEFFSESYPVKHAVAVTDTATKQCRGYGFVTFADQEDAQKAKVEFNGKQIDGKKIRVELAEARERTEGAKSEAKAKRKQERLEAQQVPKLIIRNLPWTIKKSDQLADIFKKYGKIKEAYIPKRSGGLLPGFGFVVMRSKKHAEKAIDGENGKDVDGRIIAVDWAVKRDVYQQAVQEESEDEPSDISDSSDASDIQESDLEEHDKFDYEADRQEDRSATLFIRNLPFTCTDEDLEDHFSSFGDVRYARIVMDIGTDRPKGTGFVCFRSTEDAETCLRGAPKSQVTQDQPRSILQDTTLDPTGRYTLEGRVVQVSRAVDRSEANRLTEEGVANRHRRDRDKRRLYLLSEGSISTKSKLWQSLPPSEQTMREASLKQRKTLIESNPSLNLSLTRLSIRNLPRNIDSKALKALAREAIVGFAVDVKAGKRERLSEEELARGGEEMKNAEQARREAGKGVVKQAKVVFEGESGSKVEESSGAGRSRGYGFIEYHTHRNALMGLRWLNGHCIDYQVKDPQAKVDREALQDRKKRLIVEFAIENAQVVLRRKDRELKAKERGNTKIDKKRKRDTKEPPAEVQQTPVDDKIAQRNRIIGRKRALRRNKRG